MFASKKYEKNMEIAQRAVSYIRRMLPYGANNRSDILTNNQYKKILKRINTLYFSRPFQSVAFFIPLTKDQNQPTPKQIALINTFVGNDEKINCENFRVKLAEAGNCDFQTILAFDRLKNQGIRPIEKFVMAGGRHTFLVIGRDPTLDPRDPHSWNSDAIICDPWVGECYSAKEFIYATEGQFRIESLQTKGFPRLEQGIYPGDTSVRVFGEMPWNTVTPLQGFLPILIGSYQQHLKEKLTQKDFYLLEELKDNLLRINLGKIAPDFKTVFDNFFQKTNHSSNLLEFKFLISYLTRFVYSEDYANLFRSNLFYELENKSKDLNNYSIVKYFVDKTMDYFRQTNEIKLYSLLEHLYLKLIPPGNGNNLGLLHAELCKFADVNKENPILSKVSAELLNEVIIIGAIIEKANRNKEAKTTRSPSLFFNPNTTVKSPSNDPVSHFNERTKNVRND